MLKRFSEEVERGVPVATANAGDLDSTTTISGEFGFEVMFRNSLAFAQGFAMDEGGGGAGAHCIGSSQGGGRRKEDEMGQRRREARRRAKGREGATGSGRPSCRVLSKRRKIRRQQEELADHVLLSAQRMELEVRRNVHDQGTREARHWPLRLPSRDPALLARDTVGICLVVANASVSGRLQQGSRSRAILPSAGGCTGACSSATERLRVDHYN
jgi:hypothetical protein